MLRQVGIFFIKRIATFTIFLQQILGGKLLLVLPWMHQWN